MFLGRIFIFQKNSKVRHVKCVDLATRGFTSMKQKHSHTDELKACYKEKMEKAYEILKKVMPSILNITI